ncbi:response regulator with CheY-like receiver domain and winged-helix DNA-binding domain [Schinkia azotoformans MEV2011]|uniref:Response regulator with CheY-like receiver domain and winged-helix DNA-binding domain n=1 Tax=Schinkia azotoformans MEV2011 TaxID=1348973 RepID=A0A072NSK9_SCHAZ|nr:response regulator transcription factor [Schinkia azotoformans]KEF40202.1 response regulator with CheY-like receiver domain and winged-helix DNA-binding domain [Schinkia azotoformans MEV2011]MEC1694828.1 response regulator transcription factor [Schinkia azotoformans]MEC1716811.1 response regulator transcription factor [Schinkia azotoformans]MEC1726511.1 response regulator transcription factor [Schinkia azotoformans]MEC1743093.1 response regulator transcription factor [Schinkia azotoformans]
MNHKILIIEDEDKIARILELELKHEGYETTIAANGRAGLEYALKESWDVIILDIMIPELNGIEVLRRIRKFDQLTSIILLSARDSVMDKINGLDHGANDYVTKPFDMEELLARIRVMIRTKQQLQHKQKNEDEFVLADLKVNLLTREVIRGGEKVELTKKEFDLLTFLLENHHHVLSREQILEKVWGFDYLGDTNVVDVYIGYLRKKIDAPFHEPLIHTIRGVGFTIKENNR